MCEPRKTVQRLVVSAEAGGETQTDSSASTSRRDQPSRPSMSDFLAPELRQNIFLGLFGATPLPEDYGSPRK